MATELRFPSGLYGITPEWDDTPALLKAIEQAAQGGMTALQWRRKTLTDPQARLAQATQVVRLCRALGVVCIVNDDWELAARSQAHGVHLGRDDGSIEQARLSLGAQAIIGCSCYNEPARAEHALLADADYIAFGAMYASSVKPGAVKATLEHVRQGALLASRHARQNRQAAVVAIGGITPQNAAPVIQAGASAIALITALFNAPDIRATAARCSALFR
jgi:thiamine-phosphate pyrophosphorylase